MILRVAGISMILALTVLSILSQLAAEAVTPLKPEFLGWLGMMALGSGTWTVLGQPELVRTPFYTALMVLAGLTVIGLGLLAARVCWRLGHRFLVPFLAANLAMGLANLAANWAITINVLVTQWGRPPVAGPDGTMVIGGGVIWPAIIWPLVVVVVNAAFLMFWSQPRFRAHGN